jgi:hypothetical protein
VTASDIEIRSFRAVFSLERRIYQFDRFRLNPGGVPLRGIGYAVVLMAACLLAGTLPVVSWPLDPIPWYFRDIAFPLALAALLTVLRIEGRPFHLAVGALFRHRAGPRYLMGLKRCGQPEGFWMPPPVTWIVDGSESEPRALRYRGPGAALVCFPHNRVEWSRTLSWRRHTDVSIHPIAGAATATPTGLELGPRTVLEVSRRSLDQRVVQRG